MDAPWRKPFVEMSTKEVNQHDAENYPIQELAADALGKESSLEKSSENEKSSILPLSDDPELVTSVEPEKVSLEPSKLPCDIHEQNETRLIHPTECSEAVDREGTEEQPESNRDVSQMCVRGTSDVQGESASKPERILKIGNPSGKKKKSRKLFLDAKKQQ